LFDVITVSLFLQLTVQLFQRPKVPKPSISFVFPVCAVRGRASLLSETLAKECTPNAAAMVVRGDGKEGTTHHQGSEGAKSRGRHNHEQPARLFCDKKSI